MKETRYKNILDLLVEKSSYVTAKELANKLNISSKTVRTTIYDLNKFLKGASIKSKANSGYKLIISNPIEFEHFLTAEWMDLAYEKDDYNNPEYRRHALMKEIIMTKDSVCINDLINEFSISEYTLQSDIKEIRNKLSRFNLKLKILNYDKICIIGDELDKRDCLVSILVDLGTIESYIQDKEKLGFLDCYYRTSKIISPLLVEENYEINQMVFKNFLLHLTVMILRVMQNESIQLASLQKEKLKEKKEFLLAQKIVSELEKEFDLTIDDNEKYYVAIQLVEKHLIAEKPHNFITSEINNIVIKMLKTVESATGMNFLDDLNLRISLGLHLTQLIERIHLGVSLKNPLLQQIKKNILAYDIAVISIKPIVEYCGKEVSEDEIGYLAFYFAGAIEKNRREEEKKKIAIICGSGRATSHLLKERFISKFSNIIGCLDVLDLNTVMTMNLEKYDFILTTIPLDNIYTTTPILEISTLMDEEDYQHIKAKVEETETEKLFRSLFMEELFFINYPAEEKEKFIYDISNKIDEVMECHSNLALQILNREKLISTEFDYGLALPHPLNPAYEKTFVSVVIFDKPIKWTMKDIQLIVILNVNAKDINNMKPFYDLISKRFHDERTIKHLIKAQNLKDFIQTLIKGE